ncbi:hypothetical protein [Qipengyuania sp.]|uniref:AMP-binding enzyme n=1 Tax=Qipengyuania sp. TaxID=2004515 RepID=UPI0035C81176
MAIVSLEPGSDLTEAAIRDRLDTTLASFKRPRMFQFVEALPRNSMAKIQKAILREEYEGLFERSCQVSE